MNIPLIGQKPALPPTELRVGWQDDKVFMQFAPAATLTIEEARALVVGLTQAIHRAEAERDARVAAVQANGANYA